VTTQPKNFVIDKATFIPLGIVASIIIAIVGVTLYVGEMNSRLDLIEQQLSQLQNPNYKELYDAFYTRTEGETLKKDIQNLNIQVVNIDKKLDILIALQSGINTASTN
jgi:hypothetical protein